MRRKFKNRLKGVLRQGFEVMQRFKVNVLPIHFYSQIPVISDLRKQSFWKRPYSLCGINGTNTQDHVSFVKSFIDDQMLNTLAKLQVHNEAIAENGEDSGFGFVESDFLYAFIYKQKPKKIIQVGCGVATSVMLRAAKSAGYEPEIVCVEPYPTPYLIALESRGAVQLVREQAQKIDTSVLSDLNSGDLFFLDSTHTVKPGSEVNKIILEIFPRLKEGVRLHIHDIFFPYDYTRETLTSELFFWSESVLLQAFLTQNESYVIEASFSMMHYNEQAMLKQLFPRYEPQENDQGLRINGGKHFPSSLYLRVIK